MRWSRLSVFVASVAVLGCAPRGITPQQRAVEEQFVGDRMNEWTTALNNREIENLTALYHNVPALSVIWPSGQRSIGFEAQEQAVQNMYNQAQYMNFVTQSPETDILSEEWAVTSYRYSLDVRYFDTRRELWSGFGTLLWAKDATDQLWKIHLQHLSVTPPGQ
jgi:ketosteroid isomerase-like protein